MKINFFTFDNNDMKSSKCRVMFLSLIFLKKMFIKIDPYWKFTRLLKLMDFRHTGQGRKNVFLIPAHAPLSSYGNILYCIYCIVLYFH